MFCYKLRWNSLNLWRKRFDAFSCKQQVLEALVVFLLLVLTILHRTGFRWRFCVLNPTFTRSATVGRLWYNLMDGSILESCFSTLSVDTRFSSHDHMILRFPFILIPNGLIAVKFTHKFSFLCGLWSNRWGGTSCKAHPKMIFCWPQHIPGGLYRHSNFSSLNFLQSKRGNAPFPHSTYLVPVGWRPLARVRLRK